MRTCVCLGRHFANDTTDKVREMLEGDARGRDGGVREELAAAHGRRLPRDAPKHCFMASALTFSSS
jgi:hypothetical protein